MTHNVRVSRTLTPTAPGGYAAAGTIAESTEIGTIELERLIEAAETEGVIDAMAKARGFVAAHRPPAAQADEESSE